MSWLLRRNLCGLQSQLSAVYRHKVQSFSTSPEILPDIEYAELKDKLCKGEVTLIDVRAPNELQQTGKIPNSKHIMLHLLGTTFTLSPADFESKTGFVKPEKDSPLVTMCFVGIRSQTAQLALMGAGYTNVRNYYGSFRDWNAQGGEIEFVQQEKEKDEAI